MPWEMQRLSTQSGFPFPLGVSRKNGGVNFALFSEHATGVKLVLFAQGKEEPLTEIALDPAKNRTESIWHILIKDLPPSVEYGYRVEGPQQPGMRFDPSIVLFDPYALSLATSAKWGEGFPVGKAPRGRVILDQEFDWQGVQPPHIPAEDLIIYEMHVRAFTAHASSKTKHPGTYLGIIEKIPYLKELGVNALELMPLQEFNERENPKSNPLTKEKLYNFWGYSTANFFAPMNRFSSGDAINEFKTMVRELHRHGIEVILDVVFNHTNEGNENGPSLSFRGIDNPVYYMLGEGASYKNYSGCGNTFNCNHPIVSRLIIDALRYWANEMGVDGFRFDLASILTRDPSGKPLGAPPLIAAINRDSSLSHVKLIAEAWDAGGLYQVGSFPGEGRWGEWNGVYRDVVRRFIKGTDGQAGPFATAVAGSQNIYGHDREPYHSVNFVTCHDGFSLKDLVSYQGKHNTANGENNQDGMNENDSWNCGAEGATKDHKIQALRERQMRNFHLALILSLGTPLLLMGDEYGHTRNGNNNTWGQDNALNWFLWDELKKQKNFFRFYAAAIHFRKTHPLLRRASFLTTEEVDWHGTEPFKQNWDSNSRFVAYTLKDPHHSLYIAFNAYHDPLHIQLPSPPRGQKWVRIADTSLPSPQDFQDDPAKRIPLKFTYDLPAHAALLLESR